MKSKTIAISAISAALTAIFLVIGSYLTVSDVFCTIISSVFVIIPLAINSYKGSFLAYLVGGAIGVIACLPTFAFSFVIPAYFTFFGIYPIIKNILIKTKLKVFLRFFIGCVWCVAIIYGLYFYYTLIMGLSLADLPSFISDAILYLLAPIAIIFFVIYDRFLHVAKALLELYLYRFIREN